MNNNREVQLNRDHINNSPDKGSFDVQIYPGNKSNLTDWRELWAYRDMIKQLVRRDFVVNYKQTALGIFWAVVQPIVATVTMGLVFGNLAGLSPDGVPVFLFYLAGQLLWMYFSGCVTATANTYINNSPLMSKVYFPRVVFSINAAISGLVTLGIHLLLFICLYLIYALSGATVSPSFAVLMMPIYILQLAALGLGTGWIIAALSTKYRDVAMMTSYGLLIWMYISPVVYDIDIVPDRFLWLYLLNPTAPILVNARSGLFGMGEYHWVSWIISLLITAVIFIAGNKMFNKAGRTFVDTI